MADIKKIKLKKTGEILVIKDETARTSIANLREEFEAIKSIEHNGNTYEAADLLDFLAELYESTVFTE